MATPAKASVKTVKLILSSSREDCRRRTLNLYKLYIRSIPQMLYDYDISKSRDECRAKIRKEFLRHRNVSDLRVLDVIIFKGQLKLQEICNVWITAGGLLDNFNEDYEKKPKDFLGKFLSGQGSTV